MLRLLAALLAAITLGACRPAPPPPGEPAPQPSATSQLPPEVSPPPEEAEPTASAQAGCDRPCRRRPRVVGKFDVEAAPEASGIAASRRNPNVLYVLDDGPGTTSLLAVDARNARVIRRLRIDGLNGTDTESLALGPCDPAADAPCIFIGDIGDNAAARDSITVTRVREPRVRGGARPTLPARQVVWQYPDGPVDAEALLVGSDGSLAIVTKEPGATGRGAARLYRAPAFADVTLERGARVRLPRPALPFASAVLGTVVTGGDAAEGRVVLRTYDALYEFIAPDDAAALADFPSWPVTEIPSPAEGQAEAVTYAADGCGLFTVSEGSGEVTSIPCR